MKTHLNETKKPQLLKLEAFGRGYEITVAYVGGTNPVGRDEDERIRESAISGMDGT